VDARLALRGLARAGREVFRRRVRRDRHVSDRLGLLLLFHPADREGRRRPWKRGGRAGIRRPGRADQGSLHPGILYADRQACRRHADGVRNGAVYGPCAGGSAGARKRDMREKLRDNGFVLETGFVGTPYLCPPWRSGTTGTRPTSCCCATSIPDGSTR
jgi:hypothetical protein